VTKPSTVVQEIFLPETNPPSILRQKLFQRHAGQGYVNSSDPGKTIIILSLSFELSFPSPVDFHGYRYTRYVRDPRPVVARFLGVGLAARGPVASSSCPLRERRVLLCSFLIVVAPPQWDDTSKPRPQDDPLSETNSRKRLVTLRIAI
jgi:hypothetical protein